MTSIQGLFAAGDGVGAAPHKFSSGSFTEGRLAAKAAVRYVLDHPQARRWTNTPSSQLQDRPSGRLWRPSSAYRGRSTAEEVNPHYLTPKQGLVRFRKSWTSTPPGPPPGIRRMRRLLQRGIELIQTVAGRPATPGSAEPARTAALLGTLASHLGGGGPHAASAPPSGNPLAGLLLPRRLSPAWTIPTGGCSSTPAIRRPLIPGRCSRSPMSSWCSKCPAPESFVEEVFRAATWQFPWLPSPSCGRVCA